MSRGGQRMNRRAVLAVGSIALLDGRSDVAFVTEYSLRGFHNRALRSARRHDLSARSRHDRLHLRTRNHAKVMVTTPRPYAITTLWNATKPYSPKNSAINNTLIADKMP